MKAEMLFLDCTAYLDQEGAARCRLPAEVRRRPQGSADHQGGQEHVPCHHRRCRAGREPADRPGVAVGGRRPSIAALIVLDSEAAAAFAAHHGIAHPTPPSWPSTRPSARRRCDHTTIQAAINAAASSATIVIEAGTYDGPLIIGTSLTLLGAGAAQTTITVPPSGETVIAVDTGVSAAVKGVTVSGGSSSFGDGIGNDPRAALALKEVAVRHNSARIRGGGIYNDAGPR
jgi:hypothetical protein